MGSWGIDSAAIVRRLFFLLVFGLLAARSEAHPVPFSYLDLRLEPGRIDGSLVVHIVDVAHDLNLAAPGQLLDRAYLASHAERIVALLSQRLSVAADDRPLGGEWSRTIEPLPDRQCVRLAVRWPLDRSPGRVGLSVNLFPYDERHRTFVNVYEGDALTQTILEAGRSQFDYFAGTRQGIFAVIVRFVPSGVHHILIGPDHLLFLIGLLLLGGTVRRVALIVTGFTVAHSITLSLAALHLLMPPPWIIEPFIALSIIVVGVDNLLVLQKPGSRDLRGWMALVFGFIHGFGFANVLSGMALPGRALGWSLFSFNLGVELGQLAVVIPVAAGLAVLRAKSETAWRRLAFGGSAIVVAAGVCWFAQRVFFDARGG